MRLEDLPENYRKQAEEKLGVDSRAALRRLEQKRGKRAALGGKGEDANGMVDLPGPLHVKIIRRVRDQRSILDDDNFSGGCKELRDAVAAAFGLKGDSEKDGITFEYIQEVHGEATEIQIEVRA